MARTQRSHNNRRSRQQQETKATNQASEASKDETVRLNKYIARAGVCSRRKADTLIEKGLVKINGEVVREFGYRVAPGETVEVNGKVISPQDTMYILLNKPKDVITTTSDEHGRQTVMDLVNIPEEELQGLFPVGRLDRDTVGVLLLTNDGELAHRLMHPRYEVEKLYLVRTRDSIKPHELEQLQRGIKLDDGIARADQIAYTNLPDHHEVGVMIHEGRNRQIRRMFDSLGHDIVSLERVNYAGLTCDDVRRGKWRRLFPHEVQRLRNMVKLK